MKGATAIMANATSTRAPTTTRLTSPLQFSFGGGRRNSRKMRKTRSKKRSNKTRRV